jgi:RNA polymerase sigma factor (sigma-70 family)
LVVCYHRTKTLPVALAVSESGPSDDWLAQAAKKGDQRAFAELVERYQGPVCAFVYALTGNLGQSEEIAQETFVKAWTSLTALQEAGRFRPWVYMIARNLVRLSARGNRRALSLADATDKLVSHEPSALERIIDREEERMVWRAIKTIPEKYRVPLVLFYREQQSFKKAADTLNLTEENVRKRLSRGRRMLQAELAARVESVLEGSRPGKRFAAGVMAAVIAAGGGPGRVAEAADATLPRRRLVGRSALATSAVALVGSGIFFASGSLRSREEPARIQAAAPSPRRPPVWSAALQGEVGSPIIAKGSDSPLSESAESLLDVIHFDFEDGILPPGFSLGFVMEGPPRAGNRYVAAATVCTWYPSWGTSVSVPLPNTLYRDTLVLSFDYWLPGDTDRVGLVVRDGSKGNSYWRNLETVVRQEWTHAEIRIGSFVPSQFAGRPQVSMDPGDTLTGLTINVGRFGGKPAFVDNIRLRDYAPEALAKVSIGTTSIGKIVSPLAPN